MEPDMADAPVCPLLGLEGDHRSHFTFPQPDHRCHGSHRPQRIDVAQQAELCLNVEFSTCARYRAWGPERVGAGPVRTPGSAVPVAGDGPVRPVDAPV